MSEKRHVGYCDDHLRYLAGCSRCADRAAAYKRTHHYYATRYGQQRLVPGLGSVRRLRALAANGWTWAALAQEAGVSMPHIKNTARRDGSHGSTVRFDTHHRIVKLYRRLESTPGPSVNAAMKAKTLGWAPPDRWWDDMDDPDAKPEPPYKPSRSVVAEDLIEVIEDHNPTWPYLQRQFKLERDTLMGVLRKAGRPELIARVTLTTNGPPNLITSSDVRAHPKTSAA